MKTAKSPKARAKELFRMVHGAWPTRQNYNDLHFNLNIEGWEKLGRFVLKLERKFAAAKKGAK